MFLAGIHGVHDDSSINHFRPTLIRPYNAPSFGANTLRLRAALRPTVRVTFMTMAKRRWMKRKRRRTMTVAFTSESRNWRMSAGTCRKPSRRSRFHATFTCTTKKTPKNNGGNSKSPDLAGVSQSSTRNCKRSTTLSSSVNSVRSST